MRSSTILIWIISLAALAVGARNFEEGLSLDAPVYSTIARNIARTGSWVKMDAQIPDFVPFAEHPHLGFWAMGLWLKIFPAEDWAVRIPSHLLYVAFLFGLFIYIRNRSGVAVAVWTTIFLWACHLFSNTFSTFYLDPGVLVLGSLSLWTFEKSRYARSLQWGALSGVLMGLAVAYKGLTFFGFLPVLGWLCLESIVWEKKLREVARGLAGFLAGILLVVGTYYLIVRLSELPQFFDIYFARQVTNRFARKWNLWAFFSIDFWWQLLKYSNFLLPFALLTLPRLREKRFLMLPWIYAFCFLFMFSTSGLVGGQYLIMMLPWIGWLISEGLLAKIPVRPEKVMRFTLVLSLVAVFFLQYLPIPTHGRAFTGDIQKLRQLSSQGKLRDLTIERFTDKDPFVISGGYAWYADVRVSYGETELAQTPRATPLAGYYIRGGGPAREMVLSQRGWCRVPGMEDGSLWLACANRL